MIEGLKIDFTSDDLKKHVLARADYHKGKAKWYAARIKDLGSGGEGELFARGYSNNPVDSLTSSQRTHLKQAAYFQIVHDHIVPNEIYRLNESDLTKLEISAALF